MAFRLYLLHAQAWRLSLRRHRHERRCWRHRPCWMLLGQRQGVGSPAARRVEVYHEHRRCRHRQGVKTEDGQMAFRSLPSGGRRVGVRQIHHPTRRRKESQKCRRVRGRHWRRDAVARDRIECDASKVKGSENERKEEEMGRKRRRACERLYGHPHRLGQPRCSGSVI